MCKCYFWFGKVKARAAINTEIITAAQHYQRHISDMWSGAGLFETHNSQYNTYNQPESPSVSTHDPKLDPWDP